VYAYTVRGLCHPLAGFYPAYMVVGTKRITGPIVPFILEGRGLLA